MALIQTKDPRVVRDTETQALLATNTEELIRHRQTRNKLKKATIQQRMMDERFDTQQQVMDKRFEALNGRIDRCEALLQELVQHVSTLVDKYPVNIPKRD